MADDDKSVVDAEKKETTTTGGGSTTDGVGKKKKRGIFSRIWNGLFRFHGDDFEKRLQYISKEEAMILTRMKKRSSSWRQTSRHLIIFSIVLEVIAVGYAIMTTRSGDLDWKTRAFRVLPMFLLPALSTAAYAGLANFNRICDRKDKKTLERLRAERQAKIDELKEKTNYYTTQQLIQRYDTDPAAKAAAATVLAAKLGADSGLKVSVGDDSNVNAATGRSKDVEYSQSNGLRNRRQVQNRSGSVGNMQMHTVDEETANLEMAEGFASEHNQVVVGHYQPQGPATNDGGWLARVAALLVGEDPSQSYALICGNCHMHNGLARKEDFPYVTYYCPHCHALNGPKQLEEHLGSVAPEPKPQQLEERLASVGPDAKPQQLEERLASVGPDAKSRQLEENLDSVAPDANLKPDDIVEAVSHTASPVSDSDPTSNNSAVKTGSEIEEVKEKVTSGDLDG